MNIGFVGFGELASCFAQGLLGNADIIAFDKNKETALIKAKGICNVKIVDTLDKLLSLTKYIVVAVPGKYDEDAFEALYDRSICQCLFMDMSTALPESKKRISDKLSERQAKYVDVAVMGSVPKLLHKTPMIISGNGVNDMLTFTSSLDMDITVCGNCAGKASTIKLCRSVFMKGLPALLIETHRICKKYGVEQEVFDSIYKNLTDQSFEKYSDRLIDGAYRHWKRQKEELEECVQIANNAHIDASIIHSSIRIFETLGEDDETGK